MCRFEEMWKGCIHKAKDENDFEMRWKQLIDTFFWDRECHPWLLRSYKSRHQWSSAWTGSVFTGGMKSTQSAESTNSVIKK